MSELATPVRTEGSSGLGIIWRYAIALAIVVALQWFPYTGVVMMMLVFPFGIPALLINLMLLHVGLAAAMRVIGRQWLLLPLLAYCGWATFAAFDWSVAVGLRNDVQAANAKAAAAARNADGFAHLVVASGSNLRETRPLAAALAMVAREGRFYFNGDLFFRGQDGSCRAAEADTPVRPSDTVLLFGLGYKECFVWAREAKPPASSIVLEALPIPWTRPHAHRFDVGHAARLKQSAADGAQHLVLGDVRQGHVSFIAPLPLFAFGWGLNSSAAAWKPMFEPLRISVSIGGSEVFQTTGHERDLGRAAYLVDLLGLDSLRPSGRPRPAFQ